MRLRKLLSLLVVVALVTMIVAFVVYRYKSRPFFAGSFFLIGPGFLVDWEGPRGMALDNDLYAYYDRHEHVLLVVQVSSSRNIEWVIDRRPVGDHLRIRRQDDGIVKEIEWRRDCIIYLDRKGVPTYTSLSVHEFRNAFTTPANIQDSVNDIVKRGRREQVHNTKAEDE